MIRAGERTGAARSLNDLGHASLVSLVEMRARGAAVRRGVRAELKKSEWTSAAVSAHELDHAPCSEVALIRGLRSAFQERSPESHAC
jgi:hypothetical protein